MQAVNLKYSIFGHLNEESSISKLIQVSVYYPQADLSNVRQFYVLFPTVKPSL